MKGKELRIGNYVQADGYYPYADIDGIEKEMVRIGTDSFTYEAIEPIKLTEEWFLRLGFVDGQKNGLKLIRINEFYYMCYVKESRGLDIDLKYVHQLQNLYFALTGEELSINN